ncbi:MAG: cytochrome C [Desulfovibrio sp.]|nr:cytochrome C [Desulfovibrio sp.]|tara:strand:+ start:19946 stop:20347 length:402 start_codon:yes stop_codon:yes gene_type:complete
MFRTVLLFMAGAVVAVLTVSAATAYEVPDKIVLDRVKGNKMLNTWVDKVTFAHGFHAIRVPCRDCHHKESDKTLGEFVACRQCHTDDDPKEPSGFYRAWHSDGPPSCLGCHTQKRTQGGKNPVGCTTACHKPR